MVTSSRKVGRSLAGYGGGGDYHAWDCCIVAPAPDHLSVAATCWSFPTSPFYLLQHFVQRCPFHVLQRDRLNSLLVVTIFISVWTLTELKTSSRKSGLIVREVQQVVVYWTESTLHNPLSPLS